jgi:hypothetical protein
MKGYEAGNYITAESSTLICLAAPIACFLSPTVDELSAVKNWPLELYSIVGMQRALLGELISADGLSLGSCGHVSDSLHISAAVFKLITEDSYGC